MKSKFENHTKQIQVLSLIFGTLLLFVGFYNALLEHLTDFNKSNFLLIFSSFLLVYILMTYFTHNHVHKAELKGLIFAEFLHSIIDGAVIGFAYYINPILGFGTLLSVLGHELPKTLGTYFIIKSQVRNFLESIKYLIYAQIGLPFSAFVFYIIGKQVDEKYHEYLEAIALASLLAIVIRLIIKTFQLHKHNH